MGKKPFVSWLRLPTVALRRHIEMNALINLDWICFDMSNEPPKKKKPKSDARIGGEIATYVLIFLAVFVGLLVWIAG